MRHLKSSVFLYFIYGFTIALVMSCSRDEQINRSQADDIEYKVDSLLSLMTLEEKIGQMSQVRHFDDLSQEGVISSEVGSIIHTQGPLPGSNAQEWQDMFRRLQEKALSTRLGIPLLFAVDAVHGQNTFPGATIFPHNIGLGAARNPKLVKRAAQITAIETQATGFNWAFSPCIAIPFNEKWGRVYEAFSESTDLTEELAVHSVIGHQGNLSSSKTVMATAKHYVGDGATNFGREGGETELSDTLISEILMPPYRAAVAADVGAVMVSFNTLNGRTMHANKSFITDSLKGAMGFNGMVVTDWKGYSRFGKNEIINAGVDMVMAVDWDLAGFQQGLKAGVLNNSVSMDRIDDAVKRILRQKFKLGLFKNPYPNPELISKIGSKAHRVVARQAVRESMVLLKNQNVLPIKNEIKKIVVVGEHANNTGLQSGGWTMEWQGVTENYKGATTILDGIKMLTSAEVVYDSTAVGTYQDADLAIVVVGERPYAEFFGDIGDGTGDHQLTLSEKHQNYVKTYANGTTKVVVILISGRPLVVTKQIQESDAFIAAWLPGSEGHGVAEVLLGKYNFKGKLPHSWPKYLEDFKGKYGPNLWSNEIDPLFKYGFGLEY